MYSTDPAEINEYSASGTNLDQLGTITSGLYQPKGLSVDSKGNLFVANSGFSQVLEFAPGQASSGTAFSKNVLYPIFAGADTQGNVYAVNDFGGPIARFPAGSMTPSEIGGFYYPTAFAFDSSGNLYVVDDLYNCKLAGTCGTRPATIGAVLEFTAGSSGATYLPLTGLDFPYGIAIDSSNDLFVSNVGSNDVVEYAPNSTSPKLTIASGVCIPVGLALNSASELFVLNNGASPNGDVTIYQPGATTPFATLSQGIADPRGIAIDPNLQPAASARRATSPSLDSPFAQPQRGAGPMVAPCSAASQAKTRARLFGHN